MRKEGVMSKILGIALVCLMIGSMSLYALSTSVIAQTESESPIQLWCPWEVGKAYVAGGDGYYYNEGTTHTGVLKYAVDFNRVDPVSGLKINEGEVNSTVCAAADGTVTFANDSGGDYGYMVKIEHEDGYVTYYAHLKKGSIRVRRGDKVQHGDPIGLVGGTPRWSPHLHFELRKSGKTIPPTPMSEQTLPKDGPALEVMRTYGKMMIRYNDDSPYTTVVDTLDDGFSKEGDAKYWKPIASYGRYYFSTANNAGTLPGEKRCKAFWMPNLKASGQYEVFVGFWSYNDQPKGVNYIVHYTGATKTVPINQYQNGKLEWHEISLGIYDFAKGTEGYVEVIDDTTSDVDNINVDSIRFKYIGAHPKILYEPLDIVLVTDISGSMDWEWEGERKLDTVKKAAKTFLNLMDKTTDRVGLVSFAGSATFDLYLTNDFHRAKKTIDGYSAKGKTNIGDALTKAVNELKTLGRSETAKAIIFLTNGNITTGMSENEVLTGPVDDAIDNDITIYTLGYGGSSGLKEEFLKDVAENTGGKYYNVPSPEELENIYLELSGRVVGLTLVEIEKDKLHQDEIITRPFFIDTTIDMFRAILNWVGSDLDLKLKNPSGEYVVPDAKVRYSGPDSKPEWYEIIHPEFGTWTTEIYGKDVPGDYENFTMQVMASTPITLCVRTDRATYDGGELVLLTAELKEGVEPITDTKVFAEITMSDGSSETLKLYDDGTHGDLYHGDGIYTNSFSKTYWVGIYEVKASATNGFARVDTTSFRVLTPFLVTIPVELWNRTFGGQGEDYAEAVIQTSDGGYAISGWTTSYGAGSTDAWLVKTDCYGSEQWSQTFGGHKRDGASSIIPISDGGYAIAGHTETYGKGSADFWLIKTDCYGDVIWNKVFGSRSSEDEATSVIQTSDGGYVIAGIAAGNGDAWLVKTDGYGTEEWNKTFGGYSLDVAESIIQTSDGGYAFTGFTLSYDAVGGDAWLVKTDSYGNEQWNKTFGGYKYDTADSVIQTPDGGYAIAGCTCSYGTGSAADFWLLKTDSYGNKEWSKTFGGYDRDEASTIIQTSDGGYAIAGLSLSYGTGSSDAWFIKTDCYGDEEWSKTFGGYNPDGVRSIIQRSDGYYIIVGWTRSYGAGNSDVWLIKLVPPGMRIQSGVGLAEVLGG